MARSAVACRPCGAPRRLGALLVVPLDGGGDDSGTGALDARRRPTRSRQEGDADDLADLQRTFEGAHRAGRSSTFEAGDRDQDRHQATGDSAELALLIETEGDDSPADVFFSQSPGRSATSTSKDRLQTLPDDELGLVPERFRSPTGNGSGSPGGVRVLVYNTDAVDQADLPASVLDMTDPSFAGQVGVAPSNGSFQDFVSRDAGGLGDEEARPGSRRLPTTAPRRTPTTWRSSRRSAAARSPTGW